MDTTGSTGLAERATLHDRAPSLDAGERPLAHVARKTGSERVAGSVASLPFDDDRFDFVVRTAVIEHTVDPNRAVREPLVHPLPYRPGGRRDRFGAAPRGRFVTVVVAAGRKRTSP